MNLYLTQSPLQILSACEARATMGTPDDVIIVMLSPTREANNEQIAMTLKATVWPHAIVIRPQGALSRLGLFTQITRLARQGINKLFIGDFRSLWMHRARALSRPQETWLLDDGAVTPIIQQNFFNQGVFWPPHRKGKLQKYFRQLLNQLVFKAVRVANIPIHVFSAFHIPEARYPHQQIIQHRYEHLRGLASNKNHETQQVFFFGSKLSEAQIIGHVFEVTCIIKIAEWYANKKIDFIYIPHRGDSQKKLGALTAAGILVKNLGMPAELFFAISQKIPAHIATFYSSALNNLSAMYDFEGIESFVIPTINIQHTSPEGVQLAYESLRKAGAELVKLEEVKINPIKF